MSEIFTKSKVSLSTFKPKAHGQAAYEKAPLKLGTIIGVAARESIRQNVEKPDEPYIGLTGNFRCIRIAENNTTEITQSGTCYLPDSWLEPILMVLKEGSTAVQFAYDVFIEKADNPAGYGWILKPLIEASGSDPLAALAAKVAPVAIAAPETPVAEPAKK